MVALNARVAIDVVRYIFGEDMKTAAHEADGTVGMSASTSPCYFRKSPLQTCW
jgi:hypothetical protein